MRQLLSVYFYTLRQKTELIMLFRYTAIWSEISFHVRKRNTYIIYTHVLDQGSSMVHFSQPKST